VTLPKSGLATPCAYGLLGVKIIKYEEICDKRKI
jgi:hypothetical protein